MVFPALLTFNQNSTVSSVTSGRFPPWIITSPQECGRYNNMMPLLQTLKSVTFLFLFSESSFQVSTFGFIEQIMRGWMFVCNHLSRPAEVCSLIWSSLLCHRLCCQLYFNNLICLFIYCWVEKITFTRSNWRVECYSSKATNVWFPRAWWSERGCAVCYGLSGDCGLATCGIS